MLRKRSSSSEMSTSSPSNSTTTIPTTKKNFVILLIFCLFFIILVVSFLLSSSSSSRILFSSSSPPLGDFDVDSTSKNTHHDFINDHNNKKKINPCMDEYFFSSSEQNNHHHLQQYLRVNVPDSDNEEFLRRIGDGDDFINNENIGVNKKITSKKNKFVIPPCLLRDDHRLFAVPPRTHKHILRITHRVALVSLLRVFRNASAEYLMSNENPVICILSILHTETCRPFEESLLECVNRVGLSNLENIIPEKCTKGAFWKAFVSSFSKLFVREERNANQEELWRSLPRGVIPEATTKKKTSSSFREVSDRTYAQFYHPAVCDDENNNNRQGSSSTIQVPSSSCDSLNQMRNSSKKMTIIHPFGFATPEANVARSVPKYKVFDFMPLLPARHMGKKRAWDLTIQEEQIFREFYSASYFAFTHRRGGFDCMRHWEQLAAGTVPYFVDIETASEFQVSGLPKKILQFVVSKMSGVSAHVGKVERKMLKFTSRSRKYYENSWTAGDTRRVLHFKRPGDIRFENFDIAQYQRVADELLDFTKKHATASAVVSSMLRSIGHEHDVKKVLLFSRFEYDYMMLTIHLGLSELGIKGVYYEQPTVREYFYRDDEHLSNITEAERGRRLYSRAKKLYGGGFGFAGRGQNPENDEYVWDPSVHLPEIQKRILNREFDLVIYPYCHPFKNNWRTLPMLQFVTQHVPKDRIVFVDHNDEGPPGEKLQMYYELSRMGNVFARELPDEPCLRTSKKLKCGGD